MNKTSFRSDIFFIIARKTALITHVDMYKCSRAHKKCELQLLDDQRDQNDYEIFIIVSRSLQLIERIRIESEIDF